MYYGIDEGLAFVICGSEVAVEQAEMCGTRTRRGGGATFTSVLAREASDAQRECLGWLSTSRYNSAICDGNFKAFAN